MFYNLVPIAQTPANVASFYASVVSFGRIIDSVCSEALASAISNVQQKRESWLPAERAFVNPDTRIDLPHCASDGLPCEPETRRGSSLTRERAITDRFSYASETTRHRLAGYLKVSGLLGTAPLGRKVTANGRPSRVLALNDRHHNGAYAGSGLCPSDRLNARVPDMVDPMTDDEMRQAARYRNAMKGPKFAESMDRARKVLNNAWWRNASPYLPIHANGTLRVPMLYKGQHWYDLGSGDLVSLKSLQDAHKATMDAVDAEAIQRRRDRKAELDALVEEQRKDAKRQKRGKA